MGPYYYKVFSKAEMKRTGELGASRAVRKWCRRYNVICLAMISCAFMFIGATGFWPSLRRRMLVTADTIPLDKLVQIPLIAAIFVALSVMVFKIVGKLRAAADAKPN